MFKLPFRTAVAVALAVVMVAALVPTSFAFADDAEITFTAQYRQDVVVQLDSSNTSEISSLDPQLASDSVSINVIENIFLGLTDYDPITASVRSELAVLPEDAGSIVTNDGTTYTFTLRDDVMWYQYDPATGEAVEQRPLTAADVVYGIKRSCDPRTTSYYGTISAKVITGCDVVQSTDVEDVTDDLVFGDTVEISAPDDTTVVLNIQFSASYFFSMTPMWMLRPVPQEPIEEFGDDWTEPGNIWTNGPYFVEENTRGVRRVFVRNDNLPADLAGGDGNIERIVSTLIEDIGTSFALYQDDQLDSANIPNAELQAVQSDPEYSEELVQIFDLAVFYFGFAFDKEPFSDVHARRAFSAIVDRDAFVAQINQGQGVPMIHFTPPGMAHAPPINEVGVGFNPDYARAELELAGYPNCEGFPAIEIVTYSTAGVWADFWASGAEEHLGCDPSLLSVESLEFSVLLEVYSADTPTQDRPNAWTAGWGPDYGDANNWVNDVLSCTADNDFLRECGEIDDLIDEAARETDPATRTELYAEIENAFFGEEGIVPIAPIYLRSSFVLFKSWYTGPFTTDGLFGGAHWGARSIDMAAKLAARGE
jgi:oligopeptide transport system substrate-binding protein